MKPSYRDRLALSVMDRELSADPVLRAVAGLFPRPPADQSARGAVGQQRRTDKTRRTSAHVISRPSTFAVLSIVGSALGLVCCVLGVTMHLQAAVSAAVILAAGAAVAWVVAVLRNRRTATGGDLSAGRRPSTALDGAA